VEEERVEDWRSKGTKSGKRKRREVEGEWREWRKGERWGVGGGGRGVLNPVGQKQATINLAAHTQA
jgi:hypothetical protein